MLSKCLLLLILLHFVVKSLEKVLMIFLLGKVELSVSRFQVVDDDENVDEFNDVNDDVDVYNIVFYL